MKCFGVFFLSLGLALSAQGISSEDVEIRGDLAFNWLVNQKPSSLKDQSAFETPTAYLGFEGTLSEKLYLVLETSYGRIRDSQSGQMTVLMEKAFFSYEIADSLSFQMGLVPNAWVEMMEQENPDLWLIAKPLNSALLRMDPQLRADQGLRLIWGWSHSSLSATLVNGEGLGSAEKGPKKDFLLHFQREDSWGDGRRTLWALGLMLGNHENIDVETSSRQRAMAFFKIEADKDWNLSLEMIRTKDPVDGVNLKIWDGVDLTSHGGEIVQGQGVSLTVEKYFGPQWASSLRWDRFDPAMGIDAKGLETRMLGFHYFPEPLLQISASWVDVRYDDKHTVAPRDTNQGILTARVHW